MNKKLPHVVDEPPSRPPLRLITKNGLEQKGVGGTRKVARLIREDRSVYNLVQELTARVRQAR